MRYRRVAAALALLTGVAVLSTGCVGVATAQDQSEQVRASEVAPPRSFSDTELDTAAERIAAFAGAANEQIPSVWATANPIDFTVLLTNGTHTVSVEAEGWQAVASTDVTTQQAVTTVSDTVGGFTALQFAGRRALLVHPGKAGDRATDADMVEAYETAMHESFHRYVQRLDGRVRWAGIAAADTTPLYPAPFEPRQLRRALHSELYAALTEEGSGDTHLERARYWYDRWVAKYPEEREALRSQDILEGTAEYFGVALAAQADASTKPSDRLRTPDDLARSPAAEVESSQIGAAALLIAKERGVERFDRVETGEMTPVEAALEGIDAASSAPPPSAVESTVRSAVKALNHDTGETFDGMLKQHRAGDATYLAFPNGYFTTGIEYRDTVVLTALGMQATKQLSARSPHTTLRGTVALEDTSGFLIPVEPKAVAVTGDVLTVNTKQVSVAEVPFRQRTDRAGNTVYEVAP